MVDKMLHCNWHEYSIQCSIFHIYLQQYKQILHQQEMLRQQNKIIYTKKKKKKFAYHNSYNIMKNSLPEEKNCGFLYMKL